MIEWLLLQWCLTFHRRYWANEYAKSEVEDGIWRFQTCVRCGSKSVWKVKAHA